MFTQKLYKSGNSVVVTIPQPLLEELNLKEGSEVVLQKEGDNEFLVKGQRAQLASDVDADFIKMVDEFIDEHEDMLKELAKR